MSLVAPTIQPGIGPKVRRAGCRFRPPLRLTFRFRVVPTGVTSSYSRPVLGARGTLKVTAPRGQAALKSLCRKERRFLLQPRGTDSLGNYLTGSSETLPLGFSIRS